MSVDTPHDLYLRHTNKKGASYVECHRVWDAALFLDQADKNARAEGGSICVIPEATYRKEKWKK